ncbi:MAG: mersacidin/lichenicidin family type 2 lantibiotic [Chloroflexota bacterium]|nr:mersacidin/lichenicidin family type 2 lantibiotic [Chloroflexota bacterium]
MSNLDIVRAWKDPEYRLNLSEAERALLPENPAGLIELSDADLGEVGGHTDWWCVTFSVITAISVEWCSPSGTFCGTCEMGTRGCC